MPTRPTYRTARERVAARRAALGGGPPRRRRRSCTPFVLAALLIFALVGTLVFALVNWASGTLQGFEQADPRRPGAEGDTTNLPASLREPFNVLLIGLDSRDSPEDGIRSDTLILVHVHPSGRWAGMLALPRDSMVQIPNLGIRKINTAYTYGYNNAATLYGAGTEPTAAGGAMAAETVAAFLNLPVDYIAQVDFNGFQRVIDTLGGLTLDVERPLLDPSYPTADYGYERLYIPAGLQVMDGATALRFARSRHSTSDFDRAARQQQVLRALLNDLRARDLLSQASLLPDLARSLETSVSTTLPLRDLETLQGLAELAQALDPEAILTLSLNPNDVRIVAEDGSNIYWEPNDVAAQVARLLAGPEGSSALVRIQILNGTNTQGLAGRVSARLSAQGFNVNSPADAPVRTGETRLIDYSGHPETLGRLATTLGLNPGQVYASPPADAPPAPYQSDIVLLLGADFQEGQP
ncbi:MAG: LytR family transcriptional regulator [Candidatus Viridilinea halotolerans]|uniref:LytR family transcriptional regulator n=1 Tax=Candidatus Viridilinea halotolerans TaxID=2491704 RepID=A0A426TQQ2_9CHLR|nr:MAG: LytR family transcriptional regulator [Candidatus Viridilinea halotolerans]